VRVYIQAIPQRHGYVQERIFPALDSCPVVTETRVFTDWDRHGPLWNAMRIWADIAEGQEPALILQDDVILHPDFTVGLREILEHVFEGRMEAVSLFAPPRKVMREWWEQGHNFVENYKFLWMPAILFTARFTRGLLDFAARQDTHHDDTVVGDYSRLSGIPIWNCLPSLVQHDLDVKSSLGTGVSCGGVRRETVTWAETVPDGTYREIRSIRYGRPA